jgi:hypothetical protein
MKKAIYLIILIITFSFRFSFGQVVEKAYEQNKIQLLDTYMKQFDSSSITSDDKTRDTLMMGLLSYMNKEYSNVFKSRKYKLLQREILVGQSNTLERYKGKWQGADTVSKKNHLNMLSQLLPAKYNYNETGKFLFFVPPTVIAEFDAFLKNWSNELSKEEKDKRKSFISKRINLSSGVNRFFDNMKGKYDTDKSITYTFYINYIYFNKNRNEATIEIITFDSGKTIDLVYMTKIGNFWRVTSKLNIGSI